MPFMPGPFFGGYDEGGGIAGLSFPGVPWSSPWAWLLLHIMELGVAYVLWGALHYACWKALPAAYRSTTPGMAAGLLFVPVFNFYWVFVSCVRLAEGFMAFGDEHPNRPMRNATGLAIAKTVSFVAFWTIAWFPIFTAVVAIVDAVLFVLFYRAVAFNANRVIAEESQGASRG